eukprot:TRINITY_DN16933_c0_g1_i3.p1 TRINITY_DN16933_c0_g1~~TRINITY_DN16933_c0_g1_i3.p1  ORF type:complete len:1549 (+),score=322.84 TRINITY_DN16933_c0_g1_i3:38-4648(+)
MVSTAGAGAIAQSSGGGGVLPGPAAAAAAASSGGLLHRQGLHVPCAFWPSSYVPQDIEQLAASPDGLTLAAACSSGQVYIWRIGGARSRAPEASAGLRSSVRLDAPLLALSGWLGPDRVLGLDFCRPLGAVAGKPPNGVASAEVVGVAADRMLVVCLLPGGCLRLLDSADGRCVAVFSPPVPSPAEGCEDVLLRTLNDGRHAALGGLPGRSGRGSGGDVLLADLWSGRQAASLAVPGDASLLRLASPSSLAGSSLSKRPSAEKVQLRLAAMGRESVFAWQWSPGERGSSPFFTFNFRRSYGKASADSVACLAFEGSLLFVALPSRLLLLNIGEAGRTDASESRVVASMAVLGLAGATMLPVPAADESALEATASTDAREVDAPAMDSVLENTDGVKDVDDEGLTGLLRARSLASDRSGRRLRSWGPSLRRACAYAHAAPAGSLEGGQGGGSSSSTSAGPACNRKVLVLYSWTESGELSRAAVEEPQAGDSAPAKSSSSSSRELTLQPCAQLPLADQKACKTSGAYCWWLCRGGSEVACAYVGGKEGAADEIHASSMLLPRSLSANTCGPSRRPSASWRRVASLRQVWQPASFSKRARETVLCSAAFEASGSKWLALGLSVAGGVWVASLTSSSEGDSETTLRPLSQARGFGQPACLVALGPKFLVCGDVDGHLCWWALPDFTLSGRLPGLHRVPIVQIARIWSLRPTEALGLALEPSLVASLDDFGRCQVVDLASGELRSVLQSQSGPALWLDAPLRFVQDPVGRYICAATPSEASVWDAKSGVFEGCWPHTSLGKDPEAGVGASPVGGQQRGGSAALLRQPSLGLEAIAWQASAAVSNASREGAAPSAALVPLWRYGEVMLDGPLWKLPVVTVALAGLLTKEGSPATEQGGALVTASDGSDGSPAQADEAAAAIPIGERSLRQLLRRLESLGLQLGGATSPLVPGVFGVDGSISFTLPSRSRKTGQQGAELRSLSPALRRGAATTPARRRPAGFTGTCGVLLEAAASRWGDPKEPGAAEASPASSPGAGSAASAATVPLPSQSLAPLSSFGVPAGFTTVAQLLLQAPDPGLVLQRCAVPCVHELLFERPVAESAKCLAAWVRALQAPGKAADANTAGLDLSLRFGAFGSSAGLKDAATALLSVIAFAQPRFFEGFCAPSTGAVLTESLCVRMFSRSSGPQLQSLACELFALGFARWRRHLASVPRLGRAGGQDGVVAASQGRGPGGGDGTSLKVPASSDGRSGRSPSPSARESAGRPAVVDEDLEWLSLQALALYQDSRVAASCLGVLMQIGAADPAALLQVMGRAARRLDLGATYASSALIVLVAFIKRHSTKVLPLLPRFTEVVLRCLEPSDPSLRRQSLFAVTSALHELVQTFPMVAFHQPSQKFAVGTGDGLVVVYDLRTATKWRIMEGHTGAIAALAFSKDGAKLCSYSAQDSSIRVWQCGSQGFLGGLLGSSARCVHQQTLPPAASAGPALNALRSATAAAGAAAGAAATNRGQPAAGPSWKAVALSWTESGLLRLTREGGETVQLHPD